MHLIYKGAKEELKTAKKAYFRAVRMQKQKVHDCRSLLLTPIRLVASGLCVCVFCAQIFVATALRTAGKRDPWFHVLHCCASRR